MAKSVLQAESESELESKSESESESNPKLSKLDPKLEQEPVPESESESEMESEEAIQEGRDNRVEIIIQEALPYRWICSLEILREEDKKPVRGSGFKINLFDVDRTVVITAGHCIWDKKHHRLAKQITVTFPGEEKPTVCSSDKFYVPPEFTDGHDSDYDYGLIIYDGKNEGFGWTTEIDKELMDMDVTNCGYPKNQAGCKGKRSMWITGGKTTEINEFRISYKNDTMPGQSGSPIYGWYQGYWTAIGIHTHGRKGLYNSGRRFDLQMISRLTKKINSKKLLKSAEVHIRCGNNGNVNCQSNPKEWEEFYIYPIAMTPSVASDDILPKVVIESAHWENGYITFDSKGMTSNKTEGGGEVSWKREFGPKATFYLRLENAEKEGDHNTYSFISAKSSNYRIRVDGKGANKYKAGGKVNCQYYENNKSSSIIYREEPYIASSADTYKEAERSEKISIISTS